MKSFKELMSEAKDHASMTDAELRKHISIHTRNALAHNTTKAAQENLRAAQAEMKKREKQKMSEEVEEEVVGELSEAKHVVLMTLTNPNHPAVSKRKDKIQKRAIVDAPDRETAIDSAIRHYRKQGYKPHDHHYVGLKEEVVSEGFKEGDFVKDPYGRIHRVFKVTGNMLHTGQYRGNNGYGGTDMLHKTKATKVPKPADVTEEVDQIDELNKDTLKSYADKRMASFSREKGIMPGSKEHKQWKAAQKAYDQAAAKRVVRTQAREEVEVNEAMISYSDFMDKIAMHKKAGNQIKDDKYTDKKASYTVVDKEGTAKKITHTSTGAKQEHLGNVNRDDDEDDAKEVKPTEKRGRGRPAGSKSGARH